MHGRASGPLAQDACRPKRPPAAQASAGGWPALCPPSPQARWRRMPANATAPSNPNSDSNPPTPLLQPSNPSPPGSLVQRVVISQAPLLRTSCSVNSGSNAWRRNLRKTVGLATQLPLRKWEQKAAASRARLPPAACAWRLAHTPLRGGARGRAESSSRPPATRALPALPSPLSLSLTRC